MKRAINKIAILISVLMLACTRPAEEESLLPSESMFNVTGNSFNGVASDQTIVVEFNAPAVWTAQVLSVSSWLKADLLHGQPGHAAITLAPRSDNFGTTSRTATLLVQIDGYESYSLDVVQQTASTDQISIRSKADEDGTITLKASLNGTEFSDTVWITSNTVWSLDADSQMDGILSFSHDSDPVNGVETTVPVVIRAAYSRFPSSSVEGAFYVKTADGKAVSQKFRAGAEVSVHQSPNRQKDPDERVSFELTDTTQAGVFAAGFYVDSNVRWHLADIPDWIETAQDWGADAVDVNNILPNGNVNQSRQFVALRVRQSSLGLSGRAESLTIRDERGQILKTVYLLFAGVGVDYLNSSLAFPAEDPYGNPWGFEAFRRNVSDSPETFWKQIDREFSVTTSRPFSTVADAPFHLMLVRADNGIPRRQQMHWAHVEMAGPASESAGGLYVTSLRIVANDRGDEDDMSGLTDPTLWRSAFVFLVPVSVSFDDMWNPDGTLRERYSENMTLMSQKNDPDAAYFFGFNQVSNGDTVSVSAAGQSLDYDITAGSYTRCDLVIQSSSQDGTWHDVSQGVCSVSIKTTQDDIPEKIIFSIAPNNGERNPFTGQVVGSDRLLRIEIYAFIGDDADRKLLFTFYVAQPLNS